MKIRNFDPADWCSVGTAAKLADVSPSWVRAKAKAGEWRAFEMDGLWFVLRADAAAFERHPSFGRPRKTR
jgi:hypothetical protein